MTNNINGGWIKQHRSFMQHDLYQAKPFDEFHAFIDLQFRAAYEPKTVKSYGKDIELKPGELLVGTRELSESWGWSRDKVRWFLKKLEKEGEIERKSTPRFGPQFTPRSTTQYLLTKWATYQTSHPEAHPEAHPDSHPLPKEVKKTKKIKNNTNTHLATLDAVYPAKIDNPPCRNAWQKWLDYKKTKRTSYKTVEQQTLQLKRFANHSTEAFIAAVEHSIAQNYQGLYDAPSHKKPVQFSAAATFEANLEYLKKCEERENGQENNTFLLDFAEFREKNDDGK
jgi:hypothetical protein